MQWHHYTVVRVTAIAMALGLTGYSAWLAWSHFGEPSGPIAAIVGAGMLVFAEHGWREQSWFKAVLMFVLGVVALVISGSAVLHRVSASNEARLVAARSGNLPRVQAEQALTEAKDALAAALAAAQGECRTGRGKRCEALEAREEAARQRVEEIRTKLVGLGARVAEDPGARVMAALLPVSAETYRLISPALLPIWLELTAPLLLAFGLAPPRRRKDEAASADESTAKSTVESTAKSTVKSGRRGRPVGRDPAKRKASQRAYAAKKRATGAQHLRVVK